jgi:hypothetical protein
MSSNYLTADNGVSSGVTGITQSAGSDGTLQIRTTTSGGSATTALTINNSQQTVFANTINVPNTFGFKNRIINGAMVIDQRNNGASVTPTADNTYTLDRWSVRLSAASKFSVQQTTTAPVGFVNSLKATSLSAYSVGASDFFAIQQAIEGFNTADLGWGTANAKTVTLSFQVYSSLTGTFGGSILNGAGNRSYPFTYTVSAANTWTTINVTIAGDTAGTWATNNTTGIQIWFGLGVGSTYSGTAGSWSGSTYFSATGATSVVGTNGATFYITGVQLEVGTQATSFDYRPYGTELALCQRYYYQSWGFGTYVNSGNSYSGMPVPNALTVSIGTANFPVTMRAAPTITLIDNAGATGKVSQPGLADGKVATASGINTGGFQGVNGSLSFTTGYPVNGAFSAAIDL